MSGFTLLEVLVALVVLACGLLGAAGVVISGERMASSSSLHTIAQQYAYEITDRMRANSAAVSSGSYALSSGSTASSTTNCLTTTCSTGAMAQYDLAQWQTELQALPNGAGTVTTTASGSQTSIVVTVQWTEPLWIKGGNASNSITVQTLI